jgi:iron-sulfur cluster assembly accessory protein
MTTKSIITLTPKAITKVQDILSKEQSETPMLRVLAMPSPGGKIQYMFSVEETPAENDQIFEFEKVKVLVDENSIDVLQGSEIDYIDSIMRSGFVISNPNNTGGGGCACGGGGGEGSGGCGGGGGEGSGGCACGGGGGEGSGGCGGGGGEGSGGCACGGGGGGGCGGGGGGCGCGGAH